MKCPKRGELRLYLDRELGSGRTASLESHVPGCEHCQERLQQLRTNSAFVERSLANPRVRGKAELSAQKKSAFQQTRAQRTDWRQTTMKQMAERRRAWRPILAGVAIVALLVGVYSFAPTRALARDLLGIFRVRKFAVVRLSPDQTDQAEAIAEQLGDMLFTREPEVIVDEPEERVADIAEASERAGFAARMPSYLPGGDAVHSIYVKGRTAFGLQATREALELVVALAGMDPVRVPDAFEGGTVRFEFASAVRLKGLRFELLQVWQPVATYPEALDPALVGEAGLRLMGVPEREAARLASSIDWASTLVLPVPDELIEIRELEVAGSPAVLMKPRQREERGSAVLIWQRDDVLYVLSCMLDAERMLKVAESMF